MPKFFTVGKMGKRKNKNVSLLRAISKVHVDVEIPEKTEELQPLALLGAAVEETRIGTAKIDGQKTPYLKVGVRINT